MSETAAADKVFKALASPTRRALLDALRDQPRSTGQLCALFDELDRCTVMQHLQVLTDADLVVTRRIGRERWNHLNVLPIKQIHDRWISHYAGHAASLLRRLQTDLESSPAKRHI